MGLRAVRREIGLCNALDGNRFQGDLGFGSVHAVAADFADFFYDVVAFDDFSEDGVLAGEPAGVGDGDEELRAVGAGAGVGHGEFAEECGFGEGALYGDGMA